jgi:hypothetical protein
VTEADSSLAQCGPVRHQLFFSDTARAALSAASRRGRLQAVVVSWPAGATYLPADCYRPGPFDVIVGHVAGCPVYVDVRRLELFTDWSVLLDADCAARGGANPPLQASVIETSSGSGAAEESFADAFDLAASRVDRSA